MSSQSEHNKIVGGYKEAFVACRSGQHRWPPYNTWHWKVTRGLRGRPLYYRTTLVCEVCHMIASDTIDAHTGDRTRSYRQPEGYRIPREAEVSRSDLRLELINRIARNAEEDPGKGDGQGGSRAASA
jgi:hypothetical protein